jgi:tetratricopeptide (TPR) repeat protein
MRGHGRTGLAMAVAALALAARGAELRPTAVEASAQVEELARQVEAARNNIDLVEKQYTLREETSDEAARLQRFSDGEIQYLLQDYPNAAVLFYDLVANKDFQASPRYADALYYLSDSLYQQKNYLGARLYLKQVLSLRGGHYREALARYLEIAGRLNEFAGIDDYIAQARGLSNGELPPELTYVYAKWLFRRQDLPLEERVSRAQVIFEGLATREGGPFHEQAAYFIGVGHVRLRQWDAAIEQFKKVAAHDGGDARDDKERQVRELAELSLGRVYFEMGQYDDAIDHYARVPQQSDNFPDALYEVAWAYVRKGELDKARNATEVLLLVAENSVLAPEAKILQGTLLQKLQKYDEAIDTYNQVINSYAPVRDELDALLSVNKDPVKYFDELLARNEKTLDVTRLLPPVALKWASTRQDVADAMEITQALDLGKKGIEDSKAIADRILKSLEERGLESFPVLQEGYTRADAVETQLTRAEEGLTRLEMGLTGGAFTPEQAQQLADLKAQAADLKKRIDTLPTTPEQLTARRERIQGQIDALDRQAFQLGIDIQSQAAQLTAIRKFVDDTRSQRRTTADDEKAFLEKVSLEQRALDAMQADVEALRSRLLDERTNADNAIGGEGVLRGEYAALLDRQQQLVGAVRGSAPAEAQKVLLRGDVVRADAAAVRERVGRSKGIIRQRVARRAAKLREQVMLEQRLIDGYAHDTAAVTGETRNLVGRIAFDSFRRVRQTFYDLVLKADVGVVDVAFQRKQDKTSQIQKLAAQKDRELKSLDEEFKEVLKDVD